MNLYAIITFISLIACAVSNSIERRGPKITRVIIIDAGSTGSRVHVFQFEKLSRHHLKDDDYKSVKPGLSSYANDPKQAALSLKPLLDFASEKVPKDEHKNCPIQVRATAGLRLLPEKAANAILDEVDRFIRNNYDFEVTNEKIAQLLSGQDEGLFGWVSLNYLLGNWNRAVISTATLDLGGASFQLTFEAEDPGDLPASAQKNVVLRKLVGMDREVYVKSYLGKGINAARTEIFLQDQAEGADTLSNICLPNHYSGKWEFGGKEYKIQGIDEPGSHFKQCMELAKKAFANDITAISELLDKDLYATSAVYYVAKNFNLVADKSGGEISVTDLVGAALHFCSEEALQKTEFKHDWEVFQCIDATYVSYLMLYAFKLPPGYRLNVLKEHVGEEVSWPLGAAFDVLYGSE